MFILFFHYLNVHSDSELFQNFSGKNTQKSLNNKPVETITEGIEHPGNN